MENKVLATVDGREIKQSDIYSLIQSLGEEEHFLITLKVKNNCLTKSLLKNYFILKL